MDRTAKTKQKGIKGFLYWWLESRYNSKQIYVDITILVIIALSVFLTVFQLYRQDTNIPVWIFKLENGITVFFIIEYIIRFYISTDFIEDIKAHNFFHAVIHKCSWIFSFSALLDLIALFPLIRFLRIFRAFRFFRFIKVLRFLRIFKLKRLFSHISILIKSLKESYFSFFTLLGGTFLIIIVNSVGLFWAESQVNPNTSLGPHIIFMLELIGLVDSSPETFMGKFFTFLTLFANIAFISFFISIISSKMGEIMENIKKGKVGYLDIKDHIVLCGYTNSSKKVIEELLNNKKFCSKRIVLVTESENPDISGIIYVHGDYSDIDVLKQVNIREAVLAVIFSEQKEHETVKNVDMRTVLTVYNIEQENPDIHTIAEIINEKNSEIIKEKIKGDEIIFKETIDAHLIVNCIRHPYISPMMYDLLNLKGRVLKEEKPEYFGFKGSVTFKELKKHQIESDIVIIGYINSKNEPYLAPENSTIITQADRIIYIEAE
ncbi:NAD-binding protein [Treponema sp. OMZ 840]|uniref:TrkA-related ion transporter n=1 Tax=Treponema sp. OMZ 840 TaxID=244313 RepID=UPI003D9388F3